MNKSIHNKYDDTASDREAQLRLALEHETDFKRRQALLKALWRLHQPAEPGVGLPKTRNRDGDAARAKRIEASDVGVACC